MPEIRDLEVKCEHLKWGGTGPKTLVRLLAERPSWREDKLEEAYYEATSPTFRIGTSNFRTLIVQLLEHGLARELEKRSGYRFALNETVWEQDVQLFHALDVLVHFFHENPEHRLRADCNLNTFLRRVVGKLGETRFSDLHHTVTYPIAGTIAAKLRDFSGDRSLRRFRFARRSPDQIKKAGHAVPQGDLFRGKRTKRQAGSPPPKDTAASGALPEEGATVGAASGAGPELPEPQTGSANDPPEGLPVGCVRVFDPAAFWQPVQNKLSGEMLRATPFADRQALITEFHVTATRRQRVVLALMKKLGVCRFLVFSLCGPASGNLDLRGVLGSLEIDPDGTHAALLEVDGEPFVGMVRVLPLTLDQSLYEPISKTGKLADRLEASFWGVDQF